MTEYGGAFKANLVKKMLMPGGPSANTLSFNDGNLTTDLVAMAARCEGERRDRIHAPVAIAAPSE